MTEPGCNKASPRIAIVGAGLSGLMAARVLRDRFSVSVFEKHTRPGGRCTTFDDFGMPIDSGAQYLTARSPALQPYIQRWLATGLIQPWDAALAAVSDETPVSPVSPGVTRYVACPGMDALAKALCHGLSLQFGREVSEVAYTDRWTLAFATGGAATGYDHVILALPYGALTSLTAEAYLPSALRDPAMAPCWAVVAAYHHPISPDYGGIFVNSGPLGWLAFNHTKPARSATTTLVLHATPEWSQANAGLSPQVVTRTLLDAAAEVFDLPPATQTNAFFWPEARALAPLDDRHYAHEDVPLTVCGDWCAGNRVEGALLSGLSAAQQVAEAFSGRTADLHR